MRVVVLVGIAAALVAVFAVHPWRTSARTAADPEELTVTRAALRPGRIVLTVRNDSHAVVRVAQVIVNDAYVDFEAQSDAIGARALSRLTVVYPWVRGVPYSIDLLTSSGAMVEYQFPAAQS